MTNLIPLPRRLDRARLHRAVPAPMARLTVAVLAMMIALAACDARGSLTSPTTAFSGTTRSDPSAEPAIDPALTGVWQRKLWFTDSQGRTFLSETTWSFRADGSAARIAVTVAFDLGISDRFVSEARWSARNGTLEIEWLPPRAGTTRLFYRVDGRSAQIGGDVYVRID